MIRRLRLRFILIVMAILTLIFTAVLITFNCLFFNDTCSQALMAQSKAGFTLYFILYAVAVLILFSFVAILLSKWLIRPVQDAFDRQKQFISDASHELKTPLSVISANADVLADEIGTNTYLSYIQEEVKRMNHLVQDLLTLTRLENNTIEPLDSFDLGQLVLQSALPFESTAFEAGKTLQLNVKEDIAFTGYPDKIRQLIGILLDNAIKYSGDNPVVEISAYTRSGYTYISIKDNGIGIPTGEHKRIFDKFYRITTGDRYATSGYGIGLYYVQSVVRRHGGSIALDSAPGRGTLFTLKLPRYGK
jgi:signal transduction histidine kinase